MVKRVVIFIVFILFVWLLITVVDDLQVENKRGYNYLVLVNKYSQLPDDWEKKVKLVDAKNAWDEDIKVEQNAYKNYEELKEELKDDGINIELDSVYRSVKEQQNLWDEWSNDPEKGIDYVRQYVAVPGYSEHHTGLAIDICLRKDGELVYENDDMIADRETFAKIHKKIAKHGFILRYLENREGMTGYAYEPWHLRYVGSKKIAQEIMSKELTLEEYLGLQKDVVNNTEAAKYKIEKALQDYFVTIYGNKIINSRFNVKKIYNVRTAGDNEGLKDYNLGLRDLAFEVTYQLQPSEDTDPNELTIPDGAYNEELGWVTDISRLGVLRYKDGYYSVENFGTGW